MSPDFDTALGGLVIVATIAFAALVDRFNVVGRNREETPGPGHGAAFTVAIRHCPGCASDAAVVLHACGAHTCDRGHTTTTTARGNS